jgi:alcohol dehydrogenase class IV
MHTASSVTIYTPTKVYFGSGKVSMLGEAVKQYGNCAFVVTMRELKDAGLLDPAFDSLKKSEVKYVVYDKLAGEPKCGDVDEARKVLVEAHCDVVIGIGGGSSMDFAKALALGARHPKEIWDYVNLSNRPPASIDAKKVLPIVTMPTTGGTGAEVTPFAVLMNTDTVQKGTIKDVAIFPSVAVVDPDLTISVPSDKTAAIGVDALSHMLENYFNVSNRNTYSDMLVEESLRWLVPSLSKACKNGKDKEARTGVAWGSNRARTFFLRVVFFVISYATNSLF